MDFQLSDEQVLLRDTTRDLLSRSYDPESRNKVVGSELGWSRDVWSQLADTGILGLGFDPDEAGQIEVMVVLTEVGRRLAPEPVVHAALGPGAIIAEVGSDAQKELLDEVAAGQRLLAFAHLEPGTRAASTEGVATTAVQQGDSWLLSGRKNPVLAGDCADTLVVSAKLPDGGIGLFLVDGEAVSRHAVPHVRRPARCPDRPGPGARRAARRRGGRVGRHPQRPSSASSPRCARRRSAPWKRRFG